MPLVPGYEGIAKALGHQATPVQVSRPREHPADNRHQVGLPPHGAELAIRVPVRRHGRGIQMCGEAEGEIPVDGGHVPELPLMVASLIERTLRLAMRKEGLASLPIYPEDRSCASPTIFDIVRLFKHVERYEVTNGDDILIFPAEITSTQKKLLNLLGVPIAAYQ